MILLLFYWPFEQGEGHRLSAVGRIVNMYLRPLLLACSVAHVNRELAKLSALTMLTTSRSFFSSDKILLREVRAESLFEAPTQCHGCPGGFLLLSTVQISVLATAAALEAPPWPRTESEAKKRDAASVPSCPRGGTRLASRLALNPFIFCQLQRSRGWREDQRRKG